MMNTFETLEDVVKKGEKTVAVFTTRAETNGDDLDLNQEGHTGCWVIRRNIDIQTVVIYQRTKGENKIYKAKFKKVEPYNKKINNKVRKKIFFSECELIGNTESNWSEFADTKSNPVRYFKA